eukprot:15459175-Alexandrium_andersonii.AAC.1
MPLASFQKSVGEQAGTTYRDTLAPEAASRIPTFRIPQSLRPLLCCPLNCNSQRACDLIQRRLVRAREGIVGLRLLCDLQPLDVRRVPAAQSGPVELRNHCQQLGEAGLQERAVDAPRAEGGRVLLQLLALRLIADVEQNAGGPYFGP